MLNRTFAALALLIALMFFPTAGAALTGGPDAGGYTFYDSNEGGTEDFSWQDISSFGTLISQAEWLHGILPVPVNIGFNFTFYGATYSRAYVSEYGYLTFDNHQLATFKIEPIPGKALYGSTENFIAGVWASLNPGT